MKSVDGSVWADQLGEDSSVLYVDADRFPTPLGARRAALRSPWAESARWDGWTYVIREAAGIRELPMHDHGPEGCQGVDECATIRRVWTLDADA